MQAVKDQLANVTALKYAKIYESKVSPIEEIEPTSEENFKTTENCPIGWPTDHRVYSLP